MKYTKYPKEIIKKAQSMFEQGYSFPEIAHFLGVTRTMTVFDWSKKLHWKKMEDISPSSIVSAKLLETFEHIVSFTDAIIANLQIKLQASELSIQEITRIMEKLPFLIKNLKTPEICTPKFLDSISTPQITTKDQKDQKDNVLKFLNIIDQK